ncbi:EPIDERMAL PATTERNING FACTOR-like protein 2 [Cornus florida]|uniref:EPIDERMAL PATTERNING FACTOR-like protein 2 n=1 Tax=Cornus florida TaxID=4283 RepID=UPI00289F3277|nr:EPIDERMAL PATTERNING FACTOR-like protein 2 [Cornus florida]
MGCGHNFICSHRHLYFTISFLFLFISSSTQLRFIAAGKWVTLSRTIVKPIGRSQIVEEEKTILRAQIGSRPPRCDRRCSSCGHCEAIQVPTNPQIKNGSKNSSSVSNIDYSRGDNSNYKPMSWKCKCGNSIFNP